MNDTAERLRTLWDELLGQPVGAEGLDFFSLGGQSLIATRLVGRIAEEFGVHLRLRDIFDHPTLASLGVLVAAARERTRETAARTADDAPAGGPVRLDHPRCAPTVLRSPCSRSASGRSNARCRRRRSSTRSCGWT